MTKLNHTQLHTLLATDYRFACDARDATSKYAVNLRTHVAEPLIIAANQSLYNKLVYRAVTTIVPETDEPYEIPSQNAVTTALIIADHEAEQHTVLPARRRIRIHDDLWVDLGCDDGTGLHITPDAVETAPVPDGVVWLRSANIASMNGPVAGVDIHDAVARFMRNIQQNRQTVVLLMALLVHNLIHPNGPGSQQPVLILTGSSGAGKTIGSLMYEDLGDPKKERTENAGGRIDIESLCMNVSKNSVHVLGNTQYIGADVWDTICTIVTGGSVSQRKLYSQSDVVRWFINCQLVITSVTAGRLPEDIVTRMVHIEFAPRTNGSYTEQDLWSRWDEDRDVMRTGLWQLCSQVMRMERDGGIPADHLNGRLRDFEKTLRAVDMLLDTNAEQAWLDSLGSEQALQQSDDPILMAIIHKWDRIRGRTLTGSELYTLLKPTFDRLDTGNAGTKRKAPGSSNALSQRINRVIPAIEALGIKVTPGLDSHRKIKTWLFEEGDDFSLPDDPIQQAMGFTDEQAEAFGIS